MIYLPLAVILFTFLQMKAPFILSFYRLGLGIGMRPINQPQQIIMPHCWELASPTVDANHSIPTLTYVRGLGVPLVTTFNSSVYRRGAANTARRLLFMVHRPLPDRLKSNVYPMVLCYSAAKPGVCNGSQLPGTEN